MLGAVLLLGLPVLFLLGSILYCGVLLWKMYREAVQFQIQRIIKKMGFWKTGMGRWIRLRNYSIIYVISAIISIIISIIVPLLTNKEIIEEISVFVNRLSIIEIRKFLATAGFAVFTICESLLMYERDFSKIDSRTSKSRKFLLRYLIGDFLPILLWLLFGFGVYKDYFFRNAPEWISSPGRVFQVIWGAVSIFILGATVFHNFFRKTGDL